MFRAALVEIPNALAVELEHSHPGAAASLREGLEETLTVTRLRVEGYRGLANLAVAIENDLIRRRNAERKELTTTLTM
jgi:hypothetical protein